MYFSIPFQALYGHISQLKSDSMIDQIVKHNLCGMEHGISIPKVVSEYDQEIPQSQTADNPVAPQGRATQQSRDTWKTN